MEAYNKAKIRTELTHPRLPQWKRRLAGLTHLLMAGCLAGFVYFNDRIANAPTNIQQNLQFSPDLKYHVSQVNPPVERFLINGIGKSDQSNLEISIPGRFQSFSTTGRYFVSNDNQGPSGRSLSRIRTPDGKILFSFENACVTPDETEAMKFSMGELDLVSLVDGKIRKIKAPNLISYPEWSVSPDGYYAFSVEQGAEGAFSYGPIASGKTKAVALLAGSEHSHHWISKNKILFCAKQNDLEAIVLVSSNGAIPVCSLMPGESIATAAPFGETFLTVRHHNVDGKAGFTTYSIRKISGEMIASHAIFGMPSKVFADHSGRFAVNFSELEMDLIGTFQTKLPRPHLALIEAPYQTVSVLRDSIAIAFTPNKSLAYLANEGHFTHFMTCLRERDLIAGIDTKVMDIENNIEDLWRLIGLEALFALPLAGMGLYGFRVNRRRSSIRQKECSSLVSTPVDYLVENQSLIATITGMGAAGYLLHCYGIQSIPSNFPATTTALALSSALIKGTLMGSATCLALSPLEKIRNPRIKNFFKLISFAMDSRLPEGFPEENRSYTSTFLSCDLSEQHSALSHENLLRGKTSLARLNIYKSLEHFKEEEPDIFSTGHYIANMVFGLMHFNDVRTLRKILKQKNLPESLALEYHQAWLACQGRVSEALSATDCLISHEDSSLDERILHQARVHSYLGSAKSSKLWKDAIAHMLCAIPAGSFEQVPGGTSEVLKVPSRLNPYAGKTLILKRGSDSSALRKEYELTADVCSATGGYNGFSSVPLGFVSAGESTDQKSYIALLQIEGKTFSQAVEGLHANEIEKLIVTTVFPALREYHRGLSNAEGIKREWQALDYHRIFQSKFVERMITDPEAKETILACAKPVLDYLCAIERRPIHQDLHASNILLGDEGAVFIDPAEAGLGHIGLDLAHLLHDPRLRLYHLQIRMLEEEYRRGLDPQSFAKGYHNEIRAAEFLKLCHLIGRAKTYGHPEHLKVHARQLNSTCLELEELPGIQLDNRGLGPMISFCRTLTGR